MNIRLRYNNKFITIFFLVLLMLTFQSVTKVSSFFIAIICICIMYAQSSKKYDKKTLSFALYFLYAILFIFILQYILIENFNLVSNIYIYFNIYIGLFCYLLLKDSLSNKNAYYVALIVVLLYYNLSTFYQYTQLGYLRGISSTGSSINYIAALNILTLPYIVYQIITFGRKKKIITVLNFLFLGIMLLGIFLSGSRIAFAVLIIEALVMILITIRYRLVNYKSLYYVPIIILLALLFFNFSKDFGNGWISSGWERALTIFDGGYKDSARETLIDYGIEVFNRSNILIGKGDSFLYEINVSTEVFARTYPHNFILEILLHSGLLGLLNFLLYFFFFISVIFIKLRNSRIELYISLLIIGSGFAIAYTQPFMTSGVLFNFIIFSNVFSIISEVKNNEKLISSRHSV
ncbi:O-antigen ligase family protein [Robertmurraya sp. GLU-23]